MTTPQEVLDFWFLAPGSPGHGRKRVEWFVATPEFDAATEGQLAGPYEAARRGDYDEWRAAPESCLALILLLDQAPRNLFRDSARAYGNDEKALELARHALDNKFDAGLLNPQRWFLWLPFEHAEDIACQETCLRLAESLREDPESADFIAFAKSHYDVIERFGRFPHRNAVLGRKTTPEEQAFLDAKGGFM
jgi:uncharacterized protein (DUF924 family)